MNRFMVWMGLGSLLLPLVIVSEMTNAEMPRFLGSEAAPSSPDMVWHETLESGWRESRRRNVPMVIYITSQHCRYCDAMKRDTWCDHSVRQRLKDNFVAIKLTPAKNSATLSRIDVEMYPMTLVGIPRGKIIGSRKGYQPPAALHGMLSEAEHNMLQR